MKKRIVTEITLTFFAISMLMLAFNNQQADASETIYIRADGSIDPPDVPISTTDNVTYTFTDNINGSIIIERNNIIIDGAGYTLSGSGALCGFNLTGTTNVTIQSANILEFDDGVHIDSSAYNTISGNNIRNTSSGVRLTWSSHNNTISGNNITQSLYGIYGGHSAYHNTISENNIKDNERGICLLRSSKNKFRGNDVANNTYNFVIRGCDLYEFVNDVDLSNTVDGKPIYYWINQRDLTVPLDAGYVVLVNCSEISAQNLTLTKNGEAILVAYTTNSTISNNSVAHTDYGIYLHSATNNTVSENNIVNNNRGVYVYWSSINNTISTNNVSENTYGVYISGSFENIVVDNNMDSNTHTSIWLRYSSTQNNVCRNNISGGYRGIELWSSNSNNVYENSISTISYTGINLVYSTSHNSITRNNISDAYWGIIVAESSNCTLSNNAITDTYWGVQLWESSNCTIARNHLSVIYNYGVDLYSSSRCAVSRNNITNGGYGVYLARSTNNSISTNNITSNWCGVCLDDSSSSNSISENIIKANSEYGLYINQSYGSVVTKNIIAHNNFGIYLDHQSENNTVSKNNITRNGYGVRLYRFSDRNMFSGNNLTDNEWYAFSFDLCSNSLLRNNRMNGSWHNLVLVGSSIENYIHDIDSSNTVDSKPIHYWINRRDDRVPLNAGYVALVNSINVTVEELELKSNGDGILLVNTTRSAIADNKIENTGSGIRLWKSSMNGIQRNNISSCQYGIFVDESLLSNVSANSIKNCGKGIYLYSGSRENVVSENTIARNEHSIYLWKYCNNNTFYENNIRDSTQYGIRLYQSSFNLFYHNNLLNNTQQVVVEPSGYPNNLNHSYPSAGNFWSDYIGIDIYSGPYQNETGGDGVGDTPYVIDANNTDHYPLMNPWPDTTPPVISILSPQNTTYTTSSVPLNFTVNEAASWIGYSLDNQANVTILGNTTLTGLALGPHNVIVYANDTYGNMGSSDKVYFTMVTRDVAIFNVTASPTETYVNQIVNINVTVKNKGTVSETFNVTAYYDSIPIDTQTVVNMAPMSNITIPFSWNTSGVQKGTYTISAEAEAVPSETNTTDNTYIDNTVTILNSAPTIDSYYPSANPTIQEGESQEFNITKFDLDGDPLTVAWWLNQTNTGETSDSYTYTADYESAGTYNVTVVVSDGLSQTSHQWTLTVTNVERDVAITNLILSKNIVGQGYFMNITVTVENQGALTETFNVTVYYNETAITLPNGKNHTTTTLTSGNSTTITLTWNTTGTDKGNYTISAYATPVLGETGTDDNAFTDGWVAVAMVGDVNADGNVDLKDVFAVALAFGSFPDHPRWNPNLDINSDGKVDLKDYFATCLNYGKVDP